MAHLTFHFRIRVMRDDVSLEGLLNCERFQALQAFPFLPWFRIHLDFVSAS